MSIDCQMNVNCNWQQSRNKKANKNKVEMQHHLSDDTFGSTMNFTLIELRQLLKTT